MTEAPAGCGVLALQETLNARTSHYPYSGSERRSPRYTSSRRFPQMAHPPGVAAPCVSSFLQISLARPIPGESLTLGSGDRVPVPRRRDLSRDEHRRNERQSDTWAAPTRSACAPLPIRHALLSCTELEGPEGVESEGAFTRLGGPLSALGTVRSPSGRFAALGVGPRPCQASRQPVRFLPRQA